MATSARFIATTGAAALAAGALSAPAYAQSAAAGSSTANVVSNLQLVKVDDLQFGRLVQGTTGGAVTINASSGNVSKVGDVVLVDAGRQRGKFTANAPVGLAFLISGDPTVTLNRIGGGASMTSTLNYSAGSGIGSIPFLPLQLVALQPTQTINVGGTLTVPGNQAVGSYEGQFSVTVLYL